MTIHTSAQILLAIIQMNGAELVVADDIVEGLPHSRVAIGRAYLIASRQRVRCVDADTHTASILNERDDVGELLEGVAHVGPLTRHILQYQLNPLRLGQHGIHLSGYVLHTLLLRDLLEVAPRVEVEQAQPQLLAAVHLIDHRMATALTLGSIRITYIIQVARMG